MYHAKGNLYLSYQKELVFIIPKGTCIYHTKRDLMYHTKGNLYLSYEKGPLCSTLKGTPRYPTKMSLVLSYQGGGFKLIVII